MSISTRYSAPNAAEGEFDEAALNRLGLRDAFGSILIVTVPDLTLKTLVAAIDHLVAEPGLFTLGDDPHRIGGGGNPLVFELPDGTNFSDRAFWTLVCDAAPDSFELVQRYVRCVIAIAVEAGEVPFDRQTGLCGEDALYAFIDTRLFTPRQLGRSGSKEELVAAFDLFYDYIVVNDLNHEVRQHQYIRAMLSHVSYNGVDVHRFARLVAYRLNHGQFDIGFDREDVRAWLIRDGVLKLVVDEELSRLGPDDGPLAIADSGLKTDDTEWIAANVTDAIELVYGHDPARRDVHAYVQQVSGIDVDAYVANRRNDRGGASWADDQLLVSGYNTGFHRVEDREVGWEVVG